MIIHIHNVFHVRRLHLVLFGQVQMGVQQVRAPPDHPLHRILLSVRHRYAQLRVVQLVNIVQ